MLLRRTYVLVGRRFTWLTFGGSSIVLKISVLIFLGCVSIFFLQLTSVPPPPKLLLREVGVDIEKLLRDDPLPTGDSFLISNNSDGIRTKFFNRNTSNQIPSGINCPRLFLGEAEELKKAKLFHAKSTPTTSPAEFFIRSTSDCDRFTYERGYMPKPESREEAEFPIAFSILIYKDFQLAERLLRAIYAPQNFYCLHIDAKAQNDVKEVMRRIACCFPNVFLPPKLIAVSWGHISIMHAEMICMEELLKYKWKYFINLSGQMFPTRSNAELVQVLKLFRGANDVEGCFECAKKFWLRNFFRYKFVERLSLHFPTLSLKSQPPHGVKLYKGTNQVILSRAFVVYFLYNEKSQSIVDWFSDTYVPDEAVWATLNHNPHLLAPGSFKGDADIKPIVSRLSKWLPPGIRSSELEAAGCHGRESRELCIFGVGDLPWLIKQPQLFVNKFHSDFEWLGLDCMEELVYNRTRDNIMRRLNIKQEPPNSLTQPIDLDFYRNLPFVKNISNVVHLEESALKKYYNRQDSLT